MSILPPLVIGFIIINIISLRNWHKKYFPLFLLLGIFASAVALIIRLLA
ncbi:MAG: hypothetical protein ACRC0L_10080 [Angustibacter sp.]